METKKKILILEDEDSLSKALYTKFTEEGFDCVVARNGEEGFDRVANEKPDLIILDMLMPFKNGSEFLAECKTDAVCKDIPVVVLSNLSDAERVSDAIVKGVEEYLVKADWSISDIVKKVRSILEK